MEEQNRSSKSAIDNLQPKVAFKIGVVSGLGVMFVIGFFILLGMMLNDKDFSGSNNNGGSNTNNNAVANANNNNNGGTGTTEINIQGLDKNNDWIRGDKNAKISIIEFSDIDCPFCTRFHNTMQQVLDNYDGQVNWVYRHFPLTTLHPDAFKKAVAAECVGELGGQDKFWAFLDELFEQSETMANITDIVASVGVDTGKFQTCLDSGKYDDKINNQSQQAQAAGGRGTPYSVIVAGDVKIPIPGALPYESVKSSLDALLK